MRVIIVEDQKIILAGISRMILDELPWEIETMESAEEALARIATGPAPDAIVTDIVMPGMDGLAFIEQAKKRLPFCRFLIISGHDSFSFAQKAIQLGVTDYLLKPIARRQLIETLETIAARQEDEREKRKSAGLRDFLMLQTNGGEGELRFSRLPQTPGLAAAFYCLRGGGALDASLPGCYDTGRGEHIALYLALVPPDEARALHERAVRTLGDSVSYGFDEGGDAAKALARCALAEDNRFFSEAGNPDTLSTEALRRVDDALAMGEGEEREKALELALSAAFYELENASGPARAVRSFTDALLSKLPGQKKGFSVERAWQSAKRYADFLEQVRAALDELFGCPQEETAAQRLRRYVNTHCAHPLNVRTAAEAVALSPNYASALFKKETGEALSAYIRRRQLEAARHLLVSTDMRVYEIAEQLGYADEKHFSAMFRACFHLSPNAARRLGRNGKMRGPEEKTS